jgi:hypothetical protein
MCYANCQKLSGLGVFGTEDEGSNLLLNVSNYPLIGKKPHPRRLET